MTQSLFPLFLCLFLQYAIIDWNAKSILMCCSCFLLLLLVRWLPEPPGTADRVQQRVPQVSGQLQLRGWHGRPDWRRQEFCHDRTQVSGEGFHFGGNLCFLYSAWWCTPRSLTPRGDALRVVWLSGVMHTAAESDSAGWCTLHSLTSRWDVHCRVS